MGNLEISSKALESQEPDPYYQNHNSEAYSHDNTEQTISEAVRDPQFALTTNNSEPDEVIDVASQSTQSSQNSSSTSASLNQT